MTEGRFAFRSGTDLTVARPGGGRTVGRPRAPKLRVRRLAQQGAQRDLLESTRAAIEKMAEEFAREALCRSGEARTGRLFASQSARLTRRAIARVSIKRRATPCPWWR